jgi:hypothetical protein
MAIQLSLWALSPDTRSRNTRSENQRSWADCHTGSEASQCCSLIELLRPSSILTEGPPPLGTEWVGRPPCDSFLFSVESLQQHLQLLEPQFEFLSHLRPRGFRDVRSTPTELNCRSDPQIMDRKSIEQTIRKKPDLFKVGLAKSSQRSWARLPLLTLLSATVSTLWPECPAASLGDLVRERFTTDSFFVRGRSSLPFGRRSLTMGTLPPDTG